MEFLDSLSPSVPIIHRSWPVNQHCYVDVRESRKENPLRVRPCFSSSVPHILFVLPGWFGRWKTGGCTAVVLLGADPKICLRQHVLFLCCSHLAFSRYLFASMWCNHIVVWTQVCQVFRGYCKLGRNQVLFHRIDQISIWSITCV